jgi:2,4-dienoyl-CoA reductase-like NADH-dependent reductase (Old Yellow Enzyme family)
MELLDQIEGYLTRSGTKVSMFGRQAVGDPRFVQDLREGRRPRRKTQERVRQFLMEKNS